VKQKIGDKWYGTKQVQDHYVLVGEPGSCYLSHLTAERGTGASIANGLYEAMEEMEITNKIVAVGADSTAVNTGRKGGAVRLLECKLGRPLHWFICSLHLNELHFRHLCQKLIGQTQSPNLWKGEIGKLLCSCEHLPVSKMGFQAITDDNPFPDIDFDEISCDLAYLYRIMAAIRSGTISDDLLREKPGPPSHARWLTTASRVCRLYVSTESPSPELFLLTKFVVCNYGPMWFRIKCRARCTDGPRHFLEQIRLQKMFPVDIKNTIWSVIRRNSYWAHEENALLAMLADDDLANRQAAICRIKSIRRAPISTQQQVREFLLPAVDESVETLTGLLPPACAFEPPLTMQLSVEQLDKIAEEPIRMEVPCHSQAVERCVRMVTEASSQVYGMDARDGYIKARIKSREMTPSFKSKQHFHVSETVSATVSDSV